MGNIITYNNYPNLSQGLVSYYKLDGNSNDSIGSNNGTDTNMTYGSSYGKINQGGWLKGNSNPSYFTTTRPSFIIGSQYLSISAWVFVGSSGHQVINAVYDATGYNGYFLTVNNFSFSFGVCDIYSADNTGTTIIPSYTWVHIVCVYDGTQSGNSSRMKIYINGVSQTLTFSGTIPNQINPNINTSSLMWVGSLHNNTSTLSFNGYMDEIGIWNRALSSTEVTQLYNGNNGLQYPFISTPKILSYNNKIIKFN